MVLSLHRQLKSAHLIAYVVTHLNGFLIILELFSTAVLKNHLTLLVGAFVLLTPFFMFLDLTEENELFAIITGDLQDLNELAQNVRTWPYSQLTWALEWTALGPPCDAGFAEKFPAIVAFHRVDRNFQTDATNERVLQLLMHLPIHDSLNVIAAMRQSMMMIMIAVVSMLVCQVGQR